MPKCSKCAAEFAMYPVVNGRRLDLRGRKRCLECRPLRPLRSPRKNVARARSAKICEACGLSFPRKVMVDGKLRSLYRRRFCLTCSPFGAHNTSKTPPRNSTDKERLESRRRKRNAKSYRSLKQRRRRRKADLVASWGGRCLDCGYAGAPAVFEFHHRDPATKSFTLGEFSGALEPLLREVEKCDLLCANCHRIRHALRESASLEPAVAHRRRRKLKAIAHMHSTCYACGRGGPPALFEFHHWNADEKEFGLSESGISRSWARVVAELTKCVMLCANCHREVHAGVRQLDEGLLGLAEDRLEYAA
jgi:hypothetical protein